jgi:hypothetical protein
MDKPVPLTPRTAALPRTGVAAVTSLADVRYRRPAPHATVTSVQLALALPEVDGALPAVRPRLRLVTGADQELDRFAARFAQLVVEVISGERAAHHLLRWTTADVYAEVAHRCRVLQRATPAGPRQRRLRSQVRSVRVSQPTPGVGELSIHVRHGARSRAIAGCLQLIEGRWRCSALEFG